MPNVQHQVPLLVLPAAAYQRHVERFVSGAKCRRIYLDHEMDGRIDRVRCEGEEERSDVCQGSHVGEI